MINKTILSINNLLLIILVLSPYRGVGLAQNFNHEIDPPARNNPSYIGTIGVRASLYISEGTATCSSIIEVHSGYEANLTMYLQRKNANGTWTSLVSWSGTTSGSGSVDLSELYGNLLSGYSYRVYAVGYVYCNGNYVERVSAYSQIRNY